MELAAKFAYGTAAFIEDASFRGVVVKSAGRGLALGGATVMGRRARGRCELGSGRWCREIRQSRRSHCINMEAATSKPQEVGRKVPPTRLDTNLVLGICKTRDTKSRGCSSGHLY